MLLYGKNIWGLVVKCNSIETGSSSVLDLKFCVYIYFSVLRGEEKFKDMGISYLSLC